MISVLSRDNRYDPSAEPSSSQLFSPARSGRSRPYQVIPRRPGRLHPFRLLGPATLCPCRRSSLLFFVNHDNFLTHHPSSDPPASCPPPPCSINKERKREELEILGPIESRKNNRPHSLHSPQLVAFVRLSFPCLPFPRCAFPLSCCLVLPIPRLRKNT